MPAIVGRGSFAAQGRLTLTTAVPVLTSDVTSAGTVYYTPYVGNLVSAYTGTEFLTHEFAELSCLLSDDTKSPAAAAADSLYDLFVWNDAGTLTLSRGPAWTNATTRSAGTALVRTKGVWLNNATITNGPAASRGTYVGTIATNAGAATVNMELAPAKAAGGTNNWLGVWNAYNRVSTSAIERDSTDTWEYTTLTWRPWNGDTSNVNNRITVVAGLAEGRVSVNFAWAANNSTGSTLRYGAVGVDSTTTPSGFIGMGHGAANEQVAVTAHYRAPVQLGRHFYQALEESANAGTCTWRGDGGGSFQNGLMLEMEM